MIYLNHSKPVSTLYDISYRSNRYEKFSDIGSCDKVINKISYGRYYDYRKMSNINTYRNKSRAHNMGRIYRISCRYTRKMTRMFGYKYSIAQLIDEILNDWDESYYDEETGTYSF